MKYFTFLVLFVLTNTALAEQWKLVKKTPEIQIYTRHIANSAIKEFKGISKIKTSLASLIAVWNDTSACPKWFHQCKNPMLVERLSFNDQYLYQISDFPFPASDRAILTHMQLKQNIAENSLQIEMTNAAYYCQNKSTAVCKKINAASEVRVTKSTGHLQFKSLEKGLIEVIWQQHIDPAGKLPNWLVNGVVVDMPFKTLTNLSKLAKTKKYKKAQFKLDNNGKILDILK